MKGRVESAQELIAEATTQHQNPEPQARNKADKEDSVDSFDYFAPPQYQDIHTFFSYHPQQIPNVPIPKVFNSKDGTNRK